MKTKRGSPEWKAKLSIANRGNRHSPETKQKMSLAHKGVKKSEAHKKAISNSLKGKSFSEEHKKNLSAAHSSPEAREAKAKGSREYWRKRKALEQDTEADRAHTTNVLSGEDTDEEVPENQTDWVRDV